MFGILNRTLFNAFQDSTKLNDKVLPELIIKNTLENEGTTKFSCFHLKEPLLSRLEVSGKEYVTGNMGIFIYDTRGQIRMNLNEGAEIDAMLAVTL